MTFTIPESQASLFVYITLFLLSATCTMTWISEYQRYKFFKRAKSYRDLEEWKVRK